MFPSVEILRDILCLFTENIQKIHLSIFPYPETYMNYQVSLTLYTREITRGNSCNTIKLLASDIHVRVLETMPFYLSLRLFDDVLTRSETGEGTMCARPWIMTASKPWSP